MRCSRRACNICRLSKRRVLVFLFLLSQAFYFFRGSSPSFLHPHGAVGPRALGSSPTSLLTQAPASTRSHQAPRTSYDGSALTCPVVQSICNDNSKEAQFSIVDCRLDHCAVPVCTASNVLFRPPPKPAVADDLLSRPVVVCQCGMTKEATYIFQNVTACEARTASELADGSCNQNIFKRTLMVTSAWALETARRPDDFIAEHFHIFLSLSALQWISGPGSTYSNINVFALPGKAGDDAQDAQSRAAMEGTEPDDYPKDAEYFMGEQEQAMMVKSGQLEAPTCFRAVAMIRPSQRSFVRALFSAAESGSSSPLHRFVKHMTLLLGLGYHPPKEPQPTVTVVVHRKDRLKSGLLQNIADTLRSLGSGCSPALHIVDRHSASALIHAVMQSQVLVTTAAADMLWLPRGAAVLALVTAQDHQPFHELALALNITVVTVPTGIQCNADECREALVSGPAEAIKLCASVKNGVDWRDFQDPAKEEGNREGEKATPHQKVDTGDVMAGNADGHIVGLPVREQWPLNRLMHAAQPVGNKVITPEVDTKLLELIQQFDAEKFLERTREFLGKESTYTIRRTWPKQRDYLLSGRFAASVPDSLDPCFTNAWPTSLEICGPAFEADTGSSRFMCHRQATTDSVMCEAHHFVVDLKKVKVAHGGEEPMHVLGRKESVEMPEYEIGAFRGSCKMRTVPKRDLSMYRGNPLTKIIGAVQGNSQVDTCREWEERPTIMINREEYANLFHTLRELINTFQALEIAGIITETTRAADLKGKIRLVWLDGHAKGSLDDVWASLYVKAEYVSSLPPLACFKHIIFVHPGPRNVLHQAYTKCSPRYAKEFLARFRTFALDALDLSDVTMDPTLVSLIGRRPFFSHPRVGLPLKATRGIDNEDALLQAIAAERPDLHAQLIITTPDQMTFSEQVRAIRQSRLVIGFHGAALMHVVFMQHEASMLELTLSRFWNRNHYAIVAHNIEASYMMAVLHVPRAKRDLRAPSSSQADASVVVPVKEFLGYIAMHIPPPLK